MLPYVGGSSFEHPAKNSPPAEASPVMSVRRLATTLSVFMLVPQGHGTYLALEPGQDDHQHVHEYKEDQGGKHEEVNRAGRLGSAEHPGKKREGRGNGG